MSLLDPTQSLLQAAMSGAMMRQSLLTNNLANADTPGYRPQDVNFQSTLQSAMQTGTSPSSITFTPYTEPITTTGNGNGVSPEQQSAQLAENGLLYQELTQIAAARQQILKFAMGGA